MRSEVQVLLDPPFPSGTPFGGRGALAQLGERLICIQEVRSSILLGSTIKSGGLCPQERSGGAFLGFDAKRESARQVLRLRRMVNTNTPSTRSPSLRREGSAVRSDDSLTSFREIH